MSCTTRQVSHSESSRCFGDGATLSNGQGVAFYIPHAAANDLVRAAAQRPEIRRELKSEINRPWDAALDQLVPHMRFDAKIVSLSSDEAVVRGTFVGKSLAGATHPDRAVTRDFCFTGADCAELLKVGARWATQTSMPAAFQVADFVATR